MGLVQAAGFRSSRPALEAALREGRAGSRPGAATWLVLDAFCAIEAAAIYRRETQWIDGRPVVTVGAYGVHKRTALGVKTVQRIIRRLVAVGVLERVFEGAPGRKRDPEHGSPGQAHGYVVSAAVLSTGPPKNGVIRTPKNGVIRTPKEWGHQDPPSRPTAPSVPTGSRVRKSASVVVAGAVENSAPRTPGVVLRELTRRDPDQRRPRNGPAEGWVAAAALVPDLAAEVKRRHGRLSLRTLPPAPEDDVVAQT